MRDRARRAVPAKALTALLVAGTLLADARSAQAYFDPGTGSYVLQVLIAGILGALLTVKSLWRRVSSAISRIFARGKNGKDGG